MMTGGDEDPPQVVVSREAGSFGRIRSVLGRHPLRPVFQRVASIRAGLDLRPILALVLRRHAMPLVQGARPKWAAAGSDRQRIGSGLSKIPIVRPFQPATR